MVLGITLLSNIRSLKGKSVAKVFTTALHKVKSELVFMSITC